MIDLIIFIVEKTRAFAEIALKYVTTEALVLLVIGVGMAGYLIIGSAKNAKRAIARNMNKVQEKACLDYIDGRLRIIFDMMNGDNKEAFLKGCDMYLKENNYKFSKTAIQLMLCENMKSIKKNEDLRYEYAACKEGEKLVDAIFTTLQIGLKKGPEYEKLKKQIEAEVKKKMKDMKFEIDPSTLSEELNDRVAQEMKEYAFDTNDMQHQMQQQMQLDMQQQMQLDMQMQMQQQMQLDMQIQMQQQMQLDMQMQMQQQMQTDMMNQMQSQMQTDMMNSMSSANQAMTSIDSGGFMNHDVHSGNFGPF